jgi:Xaa-Pro aminopeptidase
MEDELKKLFLTLTAITMIVSFTGCATAGQPDKQPAKQSNNLSQIQADVNASAKRVEALPQWKAYLKAVDDLRATKEWAELQKLKTVLEYQQTHK